jgi:hypothetical protein
MGIFPSKRNNNKKDEEEEVKIKLPPTPSWAIEFEKPKDTENKKNSDLFTWKLINFKNKPRSNPSTIFYRENLFVIGGFNKYNTIKSIDEYCFKTKKWFSVNNKVPKLVGYTITLIEEKNESYFLLIGGYNDNYTNNGNLIYKFNILNDKWEKIKFKNNNNNKNSSIKRWKHTSQYDKKNKKIYIFGGERKKIIKVIENNNENNNIEKNNENNKENNIKENNENNKIENNINDNYNEKNNEKNIEINNNNENNINNKKKNENENEKNKKIKKYLKNINYNDILEININDNNNNEEKYNIKKIKTKNLIKGRHSHSMVLNEYDNHLIIFGGMNNYQRRNDLVKYNINNKTFYKIKQVIYYFLKILLIKLNIIFKKIGNI